MSKEKSLSYTIHNTYSTLNEHSEKTRTVWLVIHGIGYLSRYFIRHFNHLDAQNYIIAPQAQSKYYLNGEYKHMGASWLTRENLDAEIENVLKYLDAVFDAEDLSNVHKLNILGYSQGVSVATRFVARRKIKCANLIMHSGKVPQELNKTDFDFLKETNFHFIYGTQDEYLKRGIIEVEESRLKEIFGEKINIHAFEGGHELNQEIITKIAKTS